MSVKRPCSHGHRYPSRRIAETLVQLQRSNDPSRTLPTAELCHECYGYHLVAPVPAPHDDAELVAAD